jgi:hypothetical protein
VVKLTKGVTAWGETDSAGGTLIKMGQSGPDYIGGTLIKV